MQPQLRVAVQDTSKQVNDLFETFFNTKLDEISEFDVPGYESLTQQIKDIVLRGGKRLRPFLVACGAQLTAEKVQFDRLSKSVMTVAAAVEMKHAYILAIDDITDKDETRRGGPTLWKEIQNALEKKLYSEENTAHLARSIAEIGCANMDSYVYELLADAELDSTQLNAVLKHLSFTSMQTASAGWYTHLFQALEPIDQATEKEYLKGMELVTARYTILSPLLIGASLATPLDSTLKKQIEAFSSHAGMAFQLRDDELGVFGDPKVTGKPAGNDIREGKKTVMILHAWRNADEKDKAVLRSLLEQSTITDQDLKIAQNLFRSTGALEYSQQQKEHHLSLAIEMLEKMQIHPEIKQLLQALCEYSVVRDK